MKLFRLNRKSISFKLSLLTAGLICGQMLLIAIVTSFSGVVTQAKISSYDLFSTKTASRASYIEREMNTHWNNISTYTKQISEIITYFDSESSQEWEKISPILISMLRSTTSTGAFVILDSDSDIKPALYFRDYAPVDNLLGDTDLYMIAGCLELSRMVDIPMDRAWEYQFVLTDENRSFFDKPLEKFEQGKLPEFFGYWSNPFSVKPGDIPIITYSMPLLDSNGKVVGIIGVEISLNHLRTFLPSQDIGFSGAYGYMFANLDYLTLDPISISGNTQESNIFFEKPIELKPVDEHGAIFKVISDTNYYTPIYVSLNKLTYYQGHTPFKQDEWYLVGLMEEEKLLSFSLLWQKLLIFAFVVSLGVGLAIAFGVGRSFSNPIKKIVKEVSVDTPTIPLKISLTGLSEIDELARAIEKASKNLRDSIIQMSQIINLVDISIGAFKYQTDQEELFVTERLPEILGIGSKDSYISINTLVKTLAKIMSNPEPEEQEIYCTGNEPIEWVRLRIVNDAGDVFGVVMDVTEEIQEKKRIRYGRDFDALTSLFNRAAFQKIVEEKLKENITGISSLIMFDLDGLKQINDNFGHRWGDEYIQKSADALKLMGGKDQTTGRRSGDEFYIYLHNCTNKQEIFHLMEKLYENLNNTKLNFPDGTIRPISISAGIAWLSDDMNNYDELLQLADVAMYKAKQLGRNQWVEYQKD